jgi:hypothetical protein
MSYGEQGDSELEGPMSDEEQGGPELEGPTADEEQGGTADGEQGGTALEVPMSDDEFRQLMDQVREAEQGTTPLHELAGVSPDELQDFLQNKAGLSPDEEAVGTPLAAVVTMVVHC